MEAGKSLPGTTVQRFIELPASQPATIIHTTKARQLYEKLATLGIIKCYLLSGVWTPANNSAAELSLFTPLFRELSRHSCSYNSDDGLCSTITSSSSSHAWLMWLRFSKMFRLYKHYTQASFYNKLQFLR